MSITRSYFKRLLSAVFFGVLSQSFFCPEKIKVEVEPVWVTGITMKIADTTDMRPGVLIEWEFEPLEFRGTYSFSLYYKINSDSAPVLAVMDIPQDRREISVPFPDISFSSLYYGLRASLETSTGQRWESDTIPFGRITLGENATDLLPPRDSYDGSVATVFQGRSTNDRGEFLRLHILMGLDPVVFSLDTAFPFSGVQVLFPVNSISDSIRLPVIVGDTVPVRWCLQSTEFPGNDPVDLRQAFTCSQFYKIR